MKKPKSTEELAKQLEQESEDDALWEQEPVLVERRPNQSSVLSLRLLTTEFHALLKAARGSGESVSEYVRKAIAMRLSYQPESPVVNVTSTYVGMPDEAEQSNWRTYTSGNPQADPDQTDTKQE